MNLTNRYRAELELDAKLNDLAARREAEETNFGVHRPISTENEASLLRLVLIVIFLVALSALPMLSDTSLFKVIGRF